MNALCVYSDGDIHAVINQQGDPIFLGNCMQGPCCFNQNCCITGLVPVLDNRDACIYQLEPLLLTERRTPFEGFLDHPAEVSTTQNCRRRVSHQIQRQIERHFGTEVTLKLKEAR